MGIHSCDLLAIRLQRSSRTRISVFFRIPVHPKIVASRHRLYGPAPIEPIDLRFLHIPVRSSPRLRRPCDGICPVLFAGSRLLSAARGKRRGRGEISRDVCHRSISSFDGRGQRRACWRVPRRSWVPLPRAGGEVGAPGSALPSRSGAPGEKLWAGGEGVAPSLLSNSNGVPHATG